MSVRVFRKRVALELVEGKKEAILMSATGHHSIHWGPGEDKNAEEE